MINRILYGRYFNPKQLNDILCLPEKLNLNISDNKIFFDHYRDNKRSNLRVVLSLWEDGNYDEIVYCGPDQEGSIRIIGYFSLHPIISPIKDL